MRGILQASMALLIMIGGADAAGAVSARPLSILKTSIANGLLSKG
jgi:hypothetical protein